MMDDQSHIQALSKRVYPHRRAAYASNGAAAPAGAADRLIGGRYRLSGRLGSGRLGDVYEAIDGRSGDVGIEHRVAIQLIDRKIASDARSIDALERGYSTFRAGSHPNIVRILDFGREDRSCFVAMELLEGASLRDVLEEVAALPLDEAAAVIRAVGDGLQYLHAKGLVHGNVKPQNVFVTDDYRVKLLDVMPLRRPSPVAYYVEDADTGTPTPPDIRDDVLALASLTYELLSGRHPFNANSPLEAHRAGLQPEPIEHMTLRHWQALARGLELRRGERTPTVADFLKEFGITGIERLRSAPDDESDAVPEAPEPPPPRTPARPPSAPAAPAAAAASNAELWRPPRPLPRRPEPRSASIRMPLLLIFAVGLAGAAFLAYERLRDGASQLIAAVDERLDNRPASAPTGAVVMSPPADPAIEPTGDGAQDRAAAAGEIAAETGAPEAPGQTDPPIAPETEAQTAAAVTAEGAALAETETQAEIATPAETVVPGEPSPPAESGITIETATADAERPAVAGEAPANADPAPARRSDVPAEPTRFRFSAPVVTVRESQAAATLVVQRSGDLSLPASIVWWSSDDSARAGEDYADLGQRTEDFAPGEDLRTLLIPLIGDSVPEPVESFYVYLGRFDPVRNHLEPLATVRVDIIDDD